MFIAPLLTDGHREGSSDLDLDARPVKHTRLGRFTNFSDTTCVAVHDQRACLPVGRVAPVSVALCMRACARWAATLIVVAFWLHLLAKQKVEELLPSRTDVRRRVSDDGRPCVGLKYLFITSLPTDGHSEGSSEHTFNARPNRYAPLGCSTDISDPACVAVHDQRGRARLGGLVHAGLCETGSDFDRGRLLAPPFGEAKGGKEVPSDRTRR